MNKRVAVAVAAVLVLYFGLVAPECSMGQDGETGSIKGEISVKGVRNAENVLIYVEEAPGEFPPPKEPVKMDQRKLVFIPHVLPIVKGTKVGFLNSDPVLHNVMWLASDNYRKRNLGTWGKGDMKTFTYDKEGTLVILCNVHPDMEAHIVVLQNPFSAVVGKKGTYEIKNVPPGEYTVKTWYPNARKLKSKTSKVTVAAGEAAKLDFSLSRK